jgi:heat shock protein HslJ
MGFIRRFAVLALSFLAACGGMGHKNGPILIDSSTSKQLIGKQWELKTMTVDGSRVIMHPDGRMTLAFNPEGQANGYGAINAFNVRYTFSRDGKLIWPAPGPVSTRKAGPPELMEKEQAFLSGIPKTSRAVLVGNALQLQSEDGNTVLMFVEMGQ